MPGTCGAGQVPGLGGGPESGRGRGGRGGRGAGVSRGSAVVCGAVMALSRARRWAEDVAARLEDSAGPHAPTAAVGAVVVAGLCTVRP